MNRARTLVRRALWIASTWGPTVPIVALLAVLCLKPRKPAAGGLPAEGDSLPTALRVATDVAYQEYVFVSDLCDLCEVRAEGYIRYLADNPGVILAVAESPESPLFRELLLGRREAAKRAVFFPAATFSSSTGVVAVPSALRTDSSGRIVEVGMSRLGWEQLLLTPSRWPAFWAERPSLGHRSVPPAANAEDG